MTVTTNEYGQQNMFAVEPAMYMTDEDRLKYGMESHNERAEKLNGRVAMLGFAAAVISYATTGSLFFFGAFGIRQWHRFALQSLVSPSLFCWRTP